MKDLKLPMNEDAVADRKAVMEAAQMAELLMFPTTADAQRFVTAIARLTDAHTDVDGKRVRKRKEAVAATFLATVGAFAADLIYHASNEDADGYCYRSKVRTGWELTVATSRHFETLAAAWPTMGLIEWREGYQSWQDFKGEMIPDIRKARRYRATDQLINLAQEQGISSDNITHHFMKDHAKGFPVSLKARSKSEDGEQITGKPLKVPMDDPTVKQLVADLREINRHLDQHSFNVATRPDLRRTFNCGDDPDFNWNKGGRLYATGRDSYQSMKSEERKHITIDGELTAEIDVKASHLTIFYGMMGKDLPNRNDPYDPVGVPRYAVKRYINTAFGKHALPDRWPRGFAADYAKETGHSLPRTLTAATAKEAVLQQHPIWAQLKVSPLDWSKLQFIESEAFLSVILQLMREHNVAALPVHDSLIVPLSQVVLVSGLLKDAYIQKANISPELRVTLPNSK